MPSLNLGICINFNAKWYKYAAFIDESLDNVLPKLGSVLNISKILLNFFALC